MNTGDRFESIYVTFAESTNFYRSPSSAQIAFSANCIRRFYACAIFTTPTNIPTNCRTREKTIRDLNYLLKNQNSRSFQAENMNPKTCLMWQLPNLLQKSHIKIHKADTYTEKSLRVLGVPRNGNYCRTAC